MIVSCVSCFCSKVKRNCSYLSFKHQNDSFPKHLLLYFILQVRIVCAHTNLMVLYFVWANFDQICLFTAITEKPIAKHVPTTNFSAISSAFVFDELSNQNVTGTDVSHIHQNHTHTKSVSLKVYFISLFLNLLIVTRKNLSKLFPSLFKIILFLWSIQVQNLCAKTTKEVKILFSHIHKNQPTTSNAHMELHSADYVLKVWFSTTKSKFATSQSRNTNFSFVVWCFVSVFLIFF